MNPACLRGRLYGEPCGPETPNGELCEPCARERGIGAPGATSAAEVEAAYLAGYADGYVTGARGRVYLDLDALAAYLVRRL